MKKLLALLAVLALCLGVAASAEGLPYMEQQNQDRYRSVYFLTPESYPQAALSPYDPEIALSSSFYDLWRVTFAAPENAVAVEFDYNSAQYVLADRDIQYCYELLDNYAYETMLNRCDNEQYILRDGSDGVAAYIDPEYCRARALIAVPQIKKGAKLYITVINDEMNSRTDLQKRITVMTEQIIAEIERVQEIMQVNIEDAWWSDGAYQGVKMLSDEMNDLKVTFDLPALKANGKAVRPFISGLSENRVKTCADFGDNACIELIVQVDTYSYVDYKKQDEPENGKSVVLADGYRYEIYYKPFDDGKITYFYLQRLLSNNGGYRGTDPCYLMLKVSASGISWSGLEDMMENLNILASSVTVEAEAELEDYVGTADVVLPNEPAAQPEQPAVQPQPEAQPEQPAAPQLGTWTCASCGTANTGKFCTECGAAKPAADWTCPNCKTVNAGKFCSECGTARP